LALRSVFHTGSFSVGASGSSRRSVWTATNSKVLQYSIKSQASHFLLCRTPPPPPPPPHLSMLLPSEQTFCKTDSRWHSYATSSSPCFCRPCDPRMLSSFFIALRLLIPFRLVHWNLHFSLSCSITSFHRVISFYDHTCSCVISSHR
jgi:hypothetical protein